MATLRERFLRYVTKPYGKDGCWIWIGCIQKCKGKGGGYGKIGEGGRGSRTLLAHRVAYQLFIGPIPDGMEVDHACHDATVCVSGTECLHRRCVNPSHLRLLSHPANMARGRKALQTHCLQGHEFTEENTYIDLRGHRTCRRCHTYRETARAKRRKAAA